MPVLNKELCGNHHESILHGILPLVSKVWQNVVTREGRCRIDLVEMKPGHQDKMQIHALPSQKSPRRGREFCCCHTAALKSLDRARLTERRGSQRNRGIKGKGNSWDYGDESEGESPCRGNDEKGREETEWKTEKVNNREWEGNGL